MDKKVNYIYNAEVVSVYDGDTIRVNIDMGFGIHSFGETGKGVSLRLFGINAPEVRGSSKVEGKISRDYLRSLILNKKVIIQTIRDKKGKYGRYLANVYIDHLLPLPDDTVSQVCVNQMLVTEGYAKKADY